MRFMSQKCNKINALSQILILVTKKPPAVPYFGNANNAMLYGVLAISSLAGFGAVLVGKRRKKN